MATESFLKDVTIKKTSAKQNFVRALENANKKTEKDVKISRTVKKISRDKIKAFLGDN